MSHFNGLVITTPNYKGDWECSLEAYQENIEVDEYKSCKVEDWMKYHFLTYYADKEGKINLRALKALFTGMHQGEEGYLPLEELVPFAVDYPWEKSDITKEEFFANCTIDCHPKDWCEFMEEQCKGMLETFEEEYEKYGDDYNGNEWKKDEKGVWSQYSKRNPKAKYDWYEEGGRYSCSIKTKDGHLVNECQLQDIDWTPFSKDDYLKTPRKDIYGRKYYPLKHYIEWHFTEEDVPRTLIIDGEWHERGTVGIFCITENEKPYEEWKEEFMGLIKDLPGDSEVHLVDFHI